MNFRTIMTLGVVVSLGLAGCGDFERGPAAVEEPTDPGGGDNSNDNTGGGGDGEALSFATDILPVLDAGCASCHSPSGSAASTGWVLTGDANADYEETLRFVDETSPGTSRLLTKGAGQSHGGGNIYPTDSAEFALQVEWIQGGALP